MMTEYEKKVTENAMGVSKEVGMSYLNGKQVLTKKKKKPIFSTLCLWYEIYRYMQRTLFFSWPCNVSDAYSPACHCQGPVCIPGQSM